MNGYPSELVEKIVGDLYDSYTLEELDEERNRIKGLMEKHIEMIEKGCKFFRKYRKQKGSHLTKVGLIEWVIEVLYGEKTLEELEVYMEFIEKKEGTNRESREKGRKYLRELFEECEMEIPDIILDVRSYSSYQVVKIRIGNHIFINEPGYMRIRNKEEELVFEWMVGRIKCRRIERYVYDEKDEIALIFNELMYNYELNYC